MQAAGDRAVWREMGVRTRGSHLPGSGAGAARRPGHGSHLQLGAVVVVGPFANRVLFDPLFLRVASVRKEYEAFTTKRPACGGRAV